MAATGAALARLFREDAPPAAAGQLRWLVDNVAVFARMSPAQKEAVILAINAATTAARDGEPAAPRHYTLMCGDGTNDVGALKHAHVGVSIISNPALERRYDAMRLNEQVKRRATRAANRAQQAVIMRKVGMTEARISEMMAAQEAQEAARAAGMGALDESDEELEALMKAERSATAAAASLDGGAAAAPPPPTAAGPVVPAAAATDANTPAARRAAQEAALKAKLEELQAEMAASGGDGGLVALGDASIASAFTSRLPSPLACVEILRQGRCTLVSTHQVYRILAINSLVLSYTLSVLYLHGVKQGDTQATVAGIILTAFFMTVSWAKPLRRLAPVRPRTSVFNPHLLLSVAGQFLIHLSCLMAAVHFCTPYLTTDAAAAVAAEFALPPAVPALPGAGAAAAAAAEFSTSASSIGGLNLDAGESLVDVLRAASRAATGDDAEVTPPTSSFKPNVINTVIFLLSTAQQAVTFLVNYTGEPFMQPLRDTKILLYGVLATVVAAAVAATGALEEVTTMLELVELPTAALKQAAVALILGDAAASIALEAGLRAIFGMGLQA